LLFPKLKLLTNRNFGFSLRIKFALRVFDFVEILCRHGLVVLSDYMLNWCKYRCSAIYEDTSLLDADNFARRDGIIDTMYAVDPAAVSSQILNHWLVDLPVAEIPQHTRLAWEFHDRMRQLYPTTSWNRMDIELPDHKYRVTQELVDKINLVVASAPAWGTVEVDWPSGRMLNGEELVTDDVPCRPSVPGGFYTLEGILARYSYLE
jgi:hypothetical protein